MHDNNIGSTDEVGDHPDPDDDEPIGVEVRIKKGGVAASILVCFGDGEHAHFTRAFSDIRAAADGLEELADSLRQLWRGVKDIKTINTKPRRWRKWFRRSGWDLQKMGEGWAK